MSSFRRRARKKFLSACPARGTTVERRPALHVDDISIRVPREGHDVSLSSVFSVSSTFLSACPARGTTLARVTAERDAAIFLSACPARGTTGSVLALLSSSAFLSACPGRGTTCEGYQHNSFLSYFYPRAPGGARHSRCALIPTVGIISIRVPREGHDYALHLYIREAQNFYPRAPGGARLPAPLHQRVAPIFLSACPGRGTTCWPPFACHKRRNFYPRAPGGARRGNGLCDQLRQYFYPRAPGGARRRRHRQARHLRQISIRVPREGHDALTYSTSIKHKIFLSACPGRGTTTDLAHAL